MFKKLFIAFILVALLFVGLGQVQAQAQADDLPEPGMLPDSSFYFLKSGSEAVGTFFTFGEKQKAERSFELSEKRLAEVKAIAEKDNPSSENITKAVERYEKQLEAAAEKAKQAQEKDLDMDQSLEKISEKTLKHQKVLSDVYEKVPEEAKAGIEKAMENSMKGHEESLNAISEEKRKEVEERIETKREEARNRADEMKEEGMDNSQAPERDSEREETPVEPAEPGAAEDEEGEDSESASDNVEQPETEEREEIEEDDLDQTEQQEERTNPTERP